MEQKGYKKRLDDKNNTIMITYNSIEDKNRFLQQCQIITSEELWAFVGHCKENKNLVFRGVNEAKYMGFSSAQVRTKASLSQNAYVAMISEAIQSVRGSEKIMNYIRSCSKDESDFQILALLQHYGCGTPVIDYSTDIDKALFFATDRQENPIQTASKEDNSINAFISIYYFDKRDSDHASLQEIHSRESAKLNYLDEEARREYGALYKGVSDETKNSFKQLPFKEFAELTGGGLFSVSGHSDGIIKFDIVGEQVEYNIDNERIDAQDGLFMFNALSQTPYEEAAYNWYSAIKDKNYCVNIHKSLEGEIKSYLEKRCVTCKTIYPQTKESRIITEELMNLPMDERLKPNPVRCGKEKCVIKCCLKKFWLFCRSQFLHLKG